MLFFFLGGEASLHMAIHNQVIILKFPTHAFRIYLQKTGQKNTRTRDAKRSFFLKITEGGGGEGGRWGKDRKRLEGEECGMERRG